MTAETTETVRGSREDAILAIERGIDLSDRSGIVSFGHGAQQKLAETPIRYWNTPASGRRGRREPAWRPDPDRQGSRRRIGRRQGELSRAAVLDGRGAVEEIQLLGLAAVADGLLKSLADEPDLLNGAGRPLDFHLPKIVAAAARLTALPEPTREEAAADRLSAAATQLSEALRTCWDSPRRPDTTHLDQAVRALNVEFRRLGSATA